MQINKLTYVAFEINGALDTGKYDDVTVSDVVREIKAGTIFDFLRERIGKSFNLSLLDTVEQRELLSEWQDLLGVNARKKFLATERGLCLLVAFLLEGIQRRYRDLDPQTRPRS
jgi:hypothetical protein